jgi:two-component system, cell cycle response regulator DivK
MNMSNNKILVVEDDADYREMIMVFLLRSGYEGIEAATGLEAVSRARVTRPDLIIMDLEMPAMTGDQATARLKADPSTRNIPVIVTTAFSYGSLVDRAITAGADEIMHKPFTLKLLRAAMQRHLSLDYQLPGIPMTPRELQR